MSFIPDKVDDSHLELFLAVADGIIHETTPEVITPFLDPSFPPESVEEYLRVVSRPSKLPGFKEYVKSIMDISPTDTVKLFVVLVNVLESRILAPALTGSITLIRDMTLEERAAVVRSWRDSPIPMKRRLFRTFQSLTISTFVRFGGELHNKAIGYSGIEERETIYENQVIDDYKYPMFPKPQRDGEELYLPDIDVLIIGSGSGSGVVAHTLANEGYKSIVLEKGKYFANEEYKFDDVTGFNNLYEGNGAIATSNQQLFILAGAGFGGGSTVNWSACLKTPFKVRKEWYDDFGVEWAASESYDNAQEYVWKQMGANHENINHSLANRVILEGGEKLGYAVREIDQNTGNHPAHNCGLCHLGCKYGIKQGSVACWFRDAAAKGTLFMDQVRVLKLLHKNGVANAALCEDTSTGRVFTITGPKKFVVSGGSLNTPVVLQNSGFRNKHIGKNLKLHPVTTVFGDFGKEVRSNPHQHAIMTAVCTESADLDGKAHGARIEAILNVPFLDSTLLPWQSSDQIREEMLKFQHLTNMLIITRDTSSGTVRADPKKPNALIIDYTINKFDRNALLQALLTASDMLYIQGAKEILMSQGWNPVFKSNKPMHERAITDKDYVEWRKKTEKLGLDFYGTCYGSAHQMSSCRMSGKGPGYGACDTKGRLFECKNIYVADASVMPTASGANPMITTMAIARHIALGLVDDLKPSAKL
ncbi:long chain fatty acid oxidase [Scheffersomyces xylosifermentans]|uniref:long chain fatty acid oxidase n=1 Tax=Scheffersomyces xylosifermentans TaxID=1304137 RepID=UPI00315DC1C5